MLVRPISIDEVGRFNALLDAHHWLGHRLTGQVLRYVAELDGQWVCVAGFGSAALSCAARDKFLGWSRQQQYARLIHVANNQRLCVLPAGRRVNLASAVLARVLRRLSDDYLAVYGHRVLVVETFTDPHGTPARATRLATSVRSAPPWATAAAPAPTTTTATPNRSGSTRCTATLPRSCPPRSTIPC